jgi:thymidylate synthase
VDLYTSSMRVSYVDLASNIMRYGEDVAPRGEATKEVLDYTICLSDPYDALPTGTGRGVVVGLAVAEALHLIGGVDDPALLIKIAPHYANFVGPDGKLRGSYGRRLAEQMPGVVEKIREDVDTRRAVATSWIPELDAETGAHDYPCVTTVGWMVRGGQLHAWTQMRSNDVWLGVPYDFFMFTQLQITLAGILGLPVGAYHHTSWSMHLYEKHWNAVAELEADTREDWIPKFGGISAETWGQASLRARQILKGQTPAGAIPSELAMLDVIKKYL